MNTNHESVAYRSFSPSEFEARGARKVRVSFSEQTESVLLVSALPLTVRECQLARPSNCGEFLRAFVTAFTWKHGVAHQGNDLGYGKNAKDWIIRSQVLRAPQGLWMPFNDYMAVGSILISPGRPLGEIFMGLKIESGPPEMEP